MPKLPGPGASAKALNRFLRGSDLLTSLTTTFDRKWRSLVNPPNQAISSTSVESNTVNAGDLRQQEEQKFENQIRDSSVETYRDPSLHKSIDKSHLLRSKNSVPEKDTDSAESPQHRSPNSTDVPDNDRDANGKKKLDMNQISENSNGTIILDASEKDDGQKTRTDSPRTGHNAKRPDNVKSQEDSAGTEPTDPKVEENTKSHVRYEADSNYSNKLEKFEHLTNFEARSRLKRSESLNKRSENASAKLKRSESLNKHSTERLSSPTNGKLKRSESLNKHSDRSESPNSRLKRSESLTKTEKTECNISKRRQSVRKESATKLKRKNGMPERSIKRRHTVGGTKDFDKVHWLDNKLQSEADRVVRNDYKPKKSQLRTSSPDLSTNRVSVTDTSFLIEVSFRGPSNVVFNVTNARPQSLPDANLASKVFKVPLESHV